MDLGGELFLEAGGSWRQAREIHGGGFVTDRVDVVLVSHRLGFSPAIAVVSRLHIRGGSCCLAQNLCF